MIFAFEILPLGISGLTCAVMTVHKLVADNKALKSSLHLQALLLKRSVISLDAARDVIAIQKIELRGTMLANSALSRRNEELRLLNQSGLEMVAELSEKNDALSNENVRLRVLKSSPLNSDGQRIGRQAYVES